MNESGFWPSHTLIPRIAPTEIDDETGRPLRGVVHDPTARYMGGVAGNAGLFTTATISQNTHHAPPYGQTNGTRLFAEATVKNSLAPQPRRSTHSARARLGYRFTVF